MAQQRGPPAASAGSIRHLHHRRRAEGAAQACVVWIRRHQLFNGPAKATPKASKGALQL